MIVTRYDVDGLSAAFGIDMSTAPGFGPDAGWGRVAPGAVSEPHQHDETEVFVIVRGRGEVRADGAARPVSPGVAVRFEPFETHVIENTGDEDLVFFDLYWRDMAEAGEKAGAADRRRFGRRPVFVFSTPPTPNGDLHLGHLSGPYLGADAFVRFQRMRGVEAWHLTGSDDYQSYVVDRADRDGSTPARTAAHFSAEIEATLRAMDVEVHRYTATDADATYREGLRDFFSRVVAAPQAELRTGPALVDAETGDYLYEVAVTGGCPGCGGDTGGNICEECGEPNVCADLVGPRTRRDDAPAGSGTATRFSLPLHEFRKDVAAHQQLGRVPARLRELAHRVFARERLDLPISHPSEWGVPPRETGVAGQVIWVWPEMAYGFLHGIEGLGRGLGASWQASEPDRQWKIVHFFGYDNSFYHSLLYPVLYGLAFPDWQPDVDYHVNEFYLLEGEKFSTSRRHAIWGKDVLTPATVDGVRFHLARTRPEGRRTSFDRAEYAASVNEDLVGSWQGWLHGLHRRIRESFDGRAPDAGVWTPEHVAFLARLRTRLTAVTGSLDQDGFSLNAAAAELDGIVGDVRRFTAQEHATSGLDAWRSETRTAVALELAAARLLGACARPVMPRFAARLTEGLGLAGPDAWPSLVELVPAGTVIALEEQFFHPVEAP